jgi:uncharacterized protein YbjT (DUF2867 family)
MGSGQKTAYVLGGYGFIGHACMAALRVAGFRVVGVGRSAGAARARDPGGEWRILDIARASVDDWRRVLAEADVVVNAAGALQDGARDDLAAIHEGAVARLVAALDGRELRFIQISAAGARVDASTAFMASKARGDAILAEAAFDWVILRPVLVLGAEAYGGTALLRASAALPGLGLLVAPKSLVQTVHVQDVARAVVQVAGGEIAPGIIADLTEDGCQTLGALTCDIRRWMGFSDWRRAVTLPGWLVAVAGRLADGLGWLGWRSPLRSTALAALRDGVTGDPAPWREAGGVRMRPLAETLDALPATAQERIFARAYLLLPLAIAVLSLFWLLSGLIALADPGAAQQVLTARGMAPGPALALVVGGAGLDIALGAGVLVRRWTRASCGAMIALSLAYLGAGTLLAPDLWADPLGPMLKILPAMALALFPLMMLERR